MNIPARLASYTAAVLLLGAGAFAVGNASGAPTGHLRPPAESPGHGDHGSVGQSQQAPAGAQPGGPSSPEDASAIEPVGPVLNFQREVPVRAAEPTAPVVGNDSPTHVSAGYGHEDSQGGH